MSHPGADLIVPPAAGEPVTLLDTLEASYRRLGGVRVHMVSSFEPSLKPRTDGADASSTSISPTLRCTACDCCTRPLTR